MAERISLVTARDKSLIASDVVYLVALEVDVLNESGVLMETLRLVNNNEPVVFQGTEYFPFPFGIDMVIEAGGQPTITLTAQDVTRELIARMEQYGGGVGFDVRVLVISTVNLNGQPEITLYFEVIGAGVDDYMVTWQLGTQNLLNRVIPPRRQLRDRCPWVYRDPATCRYSGPLPSCDYTLQGPNGCAVHDNSINFGGYPGIASGGFL